MRRKQMRRNELPDTCLSTLPSTGQLVVLKHGVRGYYRSEWDTGNRAENRDIADSHNRRRGITDIQETAMMAGSMFGWDTPGAEPQWYLDNARYRNATTAKGHIKDPVMSIYYPVDDFLLRYEVMGKEKLYLPVSALPRELLGARSQFVMQPDLVCGVPAMPVKAQQAQNGSYTMELESGSCGDAGHGCIRQYPTHGQSAGKSAGKGAGLPRKAERAARPTGNGKSGGAEALPPRGRIEGKAAAIGGAKRIAEHRQA